MFELTDAAGTTHQLTYVGNCGDADANTGWFGRVFSDEGVWALFHGSSAGDCGTLVEATPLGLARWVPYEEQMSVPDGAVWSENSWKHQVEALVFAASQMSATMAELRVHPRLERGVQASVMRLLGRHIESQVPPDVWARIGRARRRPAEAVHRGALL